MQTLLQIWTKESFGSFKHKMAQIMTLKILHHRILQCSVTFQVSGLLKCNMPSSTSIAPIGNRQEALNTIHISEFLSRQIQKTSPNSWTLHQSEPLKLTNLTT